ncbi:hypothetical protein CROQUDRAFT_92788 [Cronartium quercuum f. sp. fusiforme G11]|uniref:Uncharacterized protein n=1 Tax=Cronartium quercuum f. sp. fusiforme G11 TaxID=708437 RepID=A0A9P6TD60_9BASI|nr:hypothetical protein CROQUDRAFT_92788 [Cronartium quercuum f. sp. fusiforme G11]
MTLPSSTFSIASIYSAFSIVCCTYHLPNTSFQRLRLPSTDLIRSLINPSNLGRYSQGLCRSRLEVNPNLRFTGNRLILSTQLKNSQTLTIDLSNPIKFFNRSLIAALKSFLIHDHATHPDLPLSDSINIFCFLCLCIYYRSSTLTASLIQYSLWTAVFDFELALMRPKFCPPELYCVRVLYGSSDSESLRPTERPTEDADPPDLHRLPTFSPSPAFLSLSLSTFPVSSSPLVAFIFQALRDPTSVKADDRALSLI